MALTISGTTNAGVSLVAGNNPVTVATTGYVGSIASTTPGISGPASTAWYVTNYGVIAGKNTAISFAGAGTIRNFKSIQGQIVIAGAGSIRNTGYGIVQSTYQNAVYIVGGGTVRNAGTLLSTAASSQNGVRIHGDNVVINLEGGAIEGENGGDVVSNGIGTLYNAGYVEGITRYGAYFLGGGLINQAAFAAIRGGEDGVKVTGTVGTVVNAGVIFGAATAGVALLAGGSVTNQSMGSISGRNYGIYANTATGVVNEGSVSGGADGVYFKSGGSVANLAVLASISGGNNGILVTGGGGTVTNAGTITALSQFGVSLRDGGTVVNQSGGSILGHYYAIEITGASAGTVVNAGFLNANAGHAVGLWSGGAVTNMSGGTISGTTLGIAFLGGLFGTVVNAGLVTAGRQGILLEIPGAVTNQSSGTVVSNYYGVETGQYAAVVNAGQITGSAVNYGVWLAGGGSVTNQSGGSIGGGRGGIVVSPIVISPVAATISNAGTVNGATTAGVAFLAGGSVTNQSTGSISGGKFGIYANTAAPGIVLNEGGVSGGADGVCFNDGGSVANLAALASIYGNNNGIQIAGAAGTVTNAGVIAGTSSTGDGIVLQAGGGIRNQSGGTISGGKDGIDITGSSTGSVTNLGVISGPEGFGVKLLSGGGVTNLGAGLIEGANGIYASLPGTVVNEGSITNAGTTGLSVFGNGIYFKDGGSVANLAAVASIYGGHCGILIEGAAGTVTNAGTVSASGHSPVELDVGGAVTNQNGGTISGGNFAGVFVVGGVSATVVNAGLITSSTGVELASPAASLTNQSGGTIAGDGYVVNSYLAATVTNAGIITGGTSLYDVRLHGGGALINLSGGAIGGRAGILAQNAAVNVTNAGVITGTSAYGINLTAGGTVVAQGGGTISGKGAVKLAAGSTNLLQVYPGAVFNGTVNGGNTIGATSISTLALMPGAPPNAAPGAAYGTLAGLGSQFVNFARTTILPGAYWRLGGSNSLAAGTQLYVQSDSRLTANNGTFSDAGTVTNQGTIGLVLETASIAALAGSGGVTVGSGTLTLTGSVAASQKIALGSGGHLTIASGASVGFDQPLAVPGGASVVSQATTDTVSGSAAQAAAVTVYGTGASWSSAGTLQVGGAGAGSFAVESSAVATAAAAVIASASGGSGSDIAVTGAGASFTVAGALTVGAGGEGSLSLSQGAVVTAASIDEASAAGGGGVISVAGTGSALTLTGSLTVGDKGAGEVSILNGATVSALDVTIGNASSLSSGNVDVEGAGSELSVATGGVLNVGVAGGGSGVLTIGAGTTLQSNAGVVENGHASFNNNGGVVDPPFVDVTTQSNSGLGSNLYDLYVENIGAVQIVSGTGTWDTPMMLTGTSVSDAQNNINVNGDQGEWQLSSGGTLIVNANTVDAGQAIVFEDATDTLVIGQIVNNGSAGVSGTAPVVEPGAENLLQAGGFAAEIWGYVAGDKIQFDNMAVSSASVVNGNTVDLFGPGNVSLGSLAFFTKSGSKASDAGATAAAAQMPVQCFAAGTRIETANGLVRVEDLRVGDAILTADGASEPIVWIGRRAVNCARHPRPETVWPVRVAAGAFGKGRPGRDLYLSPDHAVFVNDGLVPVKLLVNGTSIQQIERRSIIYHHVELSAHAVILAEGLAVESYLDMGDRGNFSCERGMVRLVPDLATRTLQDAATMWETHGAARLVMNGARLEEARRAVPHRGALASPCDVI